MLVATVSLNMVSVFGGQQRGSMVLCKSEEVQRVYEHLECSLSYM